MMWLGALAGFVIGEMWWGWRGAVVLAFLGWLLVVIVQAQRKGSRTPPPRILPPPADRITQLEQTVAALQARIAALEAADSPLSWGARSSASVERGESTGEGEPRSGVGSSFRWGPPPGASEGRESLGEGAPTESTKTFAAAPESLDLPESGFVAGEPPTELSTAPIISEATSEPVAAAPAGSPPPIAEKGTGSKMNLTPFWGGNAIARIGLLILFFGLAFLLKYAAEHSMIPVAWRVGGVAAVGFVMLAVGWRLRERRRGFALAVQGAGVAVLYLTTFAALRLYHLLPAEAAFVLLAAIAALSAFIAVAQDSPILAAFGAGGGFLAPLLASTGEGSHVTLFSYYLVLDATILGIALFKAWRGLNVMGFAFTFLIGFAWGWQYYRPEYFGTVEPFLIAFFLLYVAVAVLFARREELSSSGSGVSSLGGVSPLGAVPPGKRALAARGVDATLVFGVPIAAIALQSFLVRGMPYALSESCAALAVFYIALATGVGRMRGAGPSLAKAFVAIALGFATLAIPLAFDARWTSAVWAIEGATIVWFGLREGRRLVRVLGVLLELGAAVAFVMTYPRLRTDIPFVDAAFVGSVMLAIGAIWTALLLDRARDRIGKAEAQFATLAFLWGLGWWVFALMREIDSFVELEHRLTVRIAALAATALAASVLSMASRWRLAAWPALGLLPVLLVCLVVGTSHQSHPFEHEGWMAWVFATAVQAWVLWRHSRDGSPGYAKLLHAGTVLLVAALGVMELQWVGLYNAGAGTAWTVAANVFVPALVALAISLPAMDSRWPVAAYPSAYRTGALLPLLAYMAFWTIYANWTSDGATDPWPYLPILNALDIAQLLVIAAVWAAWRGHERYPEQYPAGLGSTASITVGAALAFLWLNGVLLRSIHHWAGIRYGFGPMADSVIVQAALSVFWTVIALTLMLTANRLARRIMWVMGATLLGVVVAKLFLVDLARLGGLERIVSFVGVGVLMVVVGYFAPVPPRKLGSG